MHTKLVSFENNYIRTGADFSAEEGDIFACVTIDGFPEDDNEEGEVVAELFCTTHGDIVVAWRCRCYWHNETVQTLIRESLTLLKEMYAAKDTAPAAVSPPFPDDDNEVMDAIAAIGLISKAIEVGVLSSQEDGYVNVYYRYDNGEEGWVSMSIIDAANDLRNSGYIDDLKQKIDETINA